MTASEPSTSEPAAYAREPLSALFDVRGKVAAIVGAAHGHGKASALLFAAAGARVVGIDRDAVALDALAAAARERGIEVLVERADPSMEPEVVACFAKIEREHGRVDVLVNAASLVFNAPLTETSAEQFDRIMATNARAAFLAAREAVKLMLAKGEGGRIVNITTIGALHPVLNGNEAYSSAKAAATALTKNIALDYAKNGITANCVLPGAVSVPEYNDPQTSTKPRTGPGAAGIARHLSGAFSADQVAPLVLFLASPAARMITGQAIAVDGGFLVG